jgi:hypothetical protein
MSEVLKKYWGHITTKVTEHSPEILLGVGVISLAGSTVLACRATLHVYKIREQLLDNLEAIDDGRKIALDLEVNGNQEGADLYTEKNAKNDRIISYSIAVRQYIRLYAPSVALFAGGVYCLVKSHNIMHVRNEALISAYNLVIAGFNAYRSRVKTELGNEYDEHFYYGAPLEKETVVEVGEDGKKIKREVNKIIYDDTVNGSIYSRIFNSQVPAFANHDDYNWIFLKSKQDYCNWLLQRDGVIFLNDVYRELGFPKTKAGQVVGWSTAGTGDGVIDFRMKKMDIRGTELPNVLAKAIMLDFNVDGVVYDKVGLEA